MDTSRLSFSNYSRRFGVEIEVNSLDGRNFVEHPLSSGELPEGMQYIGELLCRFLKEPVNINSWHYTHDNTHWVLKPDRSCGIELCSPVSNRIYGVNKICDVVKLLSEDPLIKIDSRCSFHVHLNVSDCNSRQVAAILVNWIKCEPVFIDFLPAYRKNSRFFEHIGESNFFNHNFYDFGVIPDLLGTQKYLTVNTFHRNKSNRETIEFRIMGRDGCSSAEVARNWIVLVIHFLEMAKKTGMPPHFTHGDPTSGLLWLDPIDVMRFLGFMGDYELSIELESARKWFLSWLKKNAGTGQGLWSRESRKVAIEQIDYIISKLGIDVE